MSRSRASHGGPPGVCAKDVETVWSRLRASSRRRTSSGSASCPAPRRRKWPNWSRAAGTCRCPRSDELTYSARRVGERRPGARPAARATRRGPRDDVDCRCRRFNHRARTDLDPPAAATERAARRASMRSGLGLPARPAACLPVGKSWSTCRPRTREADRSARGTRGETTMRGQPPRTSSRTTRRAISSTSASVSPPPR